MIKTPRTSSNLLLTPFNLWDVGSNHPSGTDLSIWVPDVHVWAPVSAVALTSTLRGGVGQVLLLSNLQYSSVLIEILTVNTGCGSGGSAVSCPCLKVPCRSPYSHNGFVAIDDN